MTLAGRLLSSVPLLTAVLMFGAGVWFLRDPSVLSGLTLAWAVYGVPLCLFRMVNALRPIREGFSRLDGPTYSPWWAGHQIQWIYVAIPVLEQVVRLVPGLFSAWLRLWGSRVGKGVYWAPQFEILDRSLMEIGDRVIFGHGVFCSAHVLRRRRNGLSLYVEKIRIGDEALIGLGSRLGPGVTIADHSTVPVATDLYPRQKEEASRLTEAARAGEEAAWVSDR